MSREKYWVRGAWLPQNKSSPAEIFWQGTCSFLCTAAKGITGRLECSYRWSEKDGTGRRPDVWKLQQVVQNKEPNTALQSKIPLSSTYPILPKKECDPVDRNQDTSYRSKYVTEPAWLCQCNPTKPSTEENLCDFTHLSIHLWILLHWG